MTLNTTGQGSSGSSSLYDGKLTSTAGITAKPINTLSEGQAFVVDDCFYYWCSTATSGALEPDDKANPGVDPGYWKKIGGLQTPSAVDAIDFKPTGNPNEFVVEITYTDDAGSTYTVVDSTPVIIQGGDHDFYVAGGTTSPTNINDDIWTGGNVGFNGQNNPLAPIHPANNVSNATTPNTSDATNGFDAWTEYQMLLWQGSSSQSSTGFGVESGSLAYNTNGKGASNFHTFRFGGETNVAFRGDGYVKFEKYGAGTFNNGTATGGLIVDAAGWVRERPVIRGPINKATYGGNWLWGGWSPVYTANTGYVDEGWATAFTTTAPTASFGTPSFDVAINGNFGQKLNYQRECITREIFGWRVLLNGTVVATRGTAIVHYQDERTNLGNETINKYLYKPIGDFHWVRPGVPAGATIEIQFQHRHQVTGVQAGAYARFISGVYRECNFHFTPRNLIAA